MAKFNITVELDWVDEEGSIDDVVKNEIIENITTRFSKKLNDEIIKTAEKKVSEKINASIDKEINTILDKLLNNKFDLVDEYGDVIKAKTSAIQIIKQKLDGFLTEKVDKEGKTNSYNTCMTRLDYIINKNITYTMEQKVNKAAEQVRIALEKHIDTTLKQQIGENVAKIIGIDKIIAKG